MDLIAQGQITRNFIEPSLELLQTFNGYWSAVMPPGSKTSMAYPFPLTRLPWWPMPEKSEEKICPKCGSEMVLRMAKKGAYAGRKFWGCTDILIAGQSRKPARAKKRRPR